MLSHDGRLRTIAHLLPIAMIGHTIQLLGEDLPWTPRAALRYWTTPGWHLFLSPWVVAGIAVALAVATIGLALSRRRTWLLAFIALYIAHYLTYPFRIRNHMSAMLAALLAIGGVHLIGALSGAIDRHGRGPYARLCDRHACRAVAAMVVVTYGAAALHKMNAGFVGAESSAIQGADLFFVYGDLGDRAPGWARDFAVYGTLVVEGTFPALALLCPRIAGVFVVGLMCFHFPHVAVMNVADYPMVASAFYPALFSAAVWRRLTPHLYSVSRFTVFGALFGVAAQIWWLPWWGSLTIFGIVVMALWGWFAGALLGSQLRRP